MSAASRFAQLARLAERWIGPELAARITEPIYWRLFANARGWQNLAFGVFSDFDAALSYCRQKHHQAGFDMDHDWWSREQSRVKAHDYPVLFWLSHYGSPDTSIIDVGGSVGVSCYAFGKLMPRQCWRSWWVIELPDVVAAGRRRLEVEPNSALVYAEDWRHIGRGDVILSAGTAQYLPYSLAGKIARLPTLPRCVIVNRVPTHPSTSFVTLQNTGTALTPCQVFKHTAFVRDFLSLGYSLIDQWICPENMLHIPCHSRLKIGRYSGFCFALNHTAVPLRTQPAESRLAEPISG